MASGTSESVERRRLLEANMTKADLVNLLGQEAGKKPDEKRVLIDRAFRTYSWDRLVSCIINVEKVEWWQALLLRCLLDGPKTKKELLEDNLVSSALKKVKAEGFASDLGNFLDRKLRLLTKYEYISLAHSNGRWEYSIKNHVALQARKELSRVTNELVLEKFHTSLDYKFIQRYNHPQRVSSSPGRQYIPPTGDRVGAKPPAFRDEGAKVRRIVAFSDYRIQDVQLLLDFVRGLNPKPDLLLYGGDDVTRFGPYPTELLRAELEKTSCPPWAIRAVESEAYVFNLDSKFTDESSATRALAKVIEESLAKGREIESLIQNSLVGDPRINGKTSSALRKAIEKAGFAVAAHDYPGDFGFVSLEISNNRFRWRAWVGIDSDGTSSCRLHSEWFSLLGIGPGYATGEDFDVEHFIRERCVVLLGKEKKPTKKALVYNPVQPKNYFQELAKASTYGICAVIGNDDSESVGRVVTGKNVFNVHEAPVILGEYAVIGMEGSPTSPDEPGIGVCLYTEDMIRKHLASFGPFVQQRKLIVISHAPPRGVLDYAVRFGRREIGSQSLRKFVETNHSVRLVVSGHVHRCGGRVSKLADAYVANAASHDNFGEPGKVAVIDIESTGEMKFYWQLLHELPGIFGVGEKTLEKLNSAGIEQVEDLLKADIARISELARLSVGNLERFALHAKALVEGRPIVLSTLDKPEGPMVYLDIETNLDQSLVWLVGVYSESRREFRGFFAKAESEEKKILADFLRFMALEPNSAIGFYACTGFDKRVLESRLSEHGLPTEVCERMFDLCIPLRKAVVFPLKSYGIKSLSTYFGYEYKHPELDGFAVAQMYLDEYLASHDPALEQRLLEYNKDDVMFLKDLTDQVSLLTSKGR